MHPCDFDRAYGSGRRRRQLARRARRAADAVAGAAHWLQSWENPDASVAQTKSYVQSECEFMLTQQAMIALEAMTNRCVQGWAQFELGDDFRMPKPQLCSFWLWTWVRSGMHTEALTNACRSRTDDAIASLAKECAEASVSLDAIEAKVNPQGKRKKRQVDWRAERIWPDYRDAEEEVLRLQQQWFADFSPSDEIFDPKIDYAAKWKQVCKDHRKQARKDRRSRRGPAGSVA